VDRVSEYCEKRSLNIPDNLADHWEWTRTRFPDADKMSSCLQGSWMIFTARDRKPKRGTLHTPICPPLHASTPPLPHTFASPRGSGMAGNETNAPCLTKFWRLAASLATAPWPGTRVPRTPRPRS
jgi:hypothetical protein